MRKLIEGAIGHVIQFKVCLNGEIVFDGELFDGFFAIGLRNGIASSPSVFGKKQNVPPRIVEFRSRSVDGGVEAVGNSGNNFSCERLVLVLPIVPLVILAIKLGSPGPVLYRQKRVGRGGTIFYCYKFRTMRKDAEADTGPTWADDDDPRITSIGRILRLTRLDEIPQLWCVLKGDMAFVGPRPERPEFVERLTREIPFYPVRHVVRPGITGWAQIRYKYGNTVEDARQKLQYDLFYIKNASLGLDLLIMFQTIKIVLLGRGAQ